MDALFAVGSSEMCKLETHVDETELIPEMDHTQIKTNTNTNCSDLISSTRFKDWIKS